MRAQKVAIEKDDLRIAMASISKSLITTCQSEPSFRTLYFATRHSYVRATTKHSSTAP